MVNRAVEMEVPDGREAAADSFDVGPLVVGAQTGEAYRRLGPEIHAFLIRVTRDEETASDLLDDAFTKLLVEERGGRWPDSPRAWLYRVSSNLATSRGRRLRVAARVDRLLHGREAGRTSEGPERDVLRHEQRDELEHALASVPPDARAAPLLAAQGYDGATIAAMLGRSEGATRTMMRRARMRLRDVLREDER